MSAPNGTQSVNFDVNAHFERAATTYEKSGGNFTRRISAHLISITSPPLSPSSVVLDNACGPGITCTEILAKLPKDQWPATIHATDFSPAMIRELAKKGHPEIKGEVMDAMDLKFGDAYFTHIYFAFAIFAVPDATKAAVELHRTLQPGGTAYVTTWESLGWAPLVDRAIHAVRANAPTYKGPLPEVWMSSQKLEDVLVSGGFERGKVEVSKFDCSMTPEGFDGILDFMTSGVLNAVIGSWSEEEKVRVMEELKLEVEGLKRNNETIPMPAWVGVARK